MVDTVILVTDAIQLLRYVLAIYDKLRYIIPRRKQNHITFNISVEKVILMISGPCSLSTERDEAIFTQTVGSVLYDTGKGFVVWVKDNQISVEPDVLLQMILSRPSFAGDISPPTNATNVSAARKVQSPPGDRMTSHPLQETHDVPLRQEQTFNQLHQTLPKQTLDPISGREYLPPVGGFVMLKTRLFRGIISYEPSDIEIFLPGFKVPDYIERQLREKHSNIPEAIVKITWERSGDLACSVLTDSKAIEKEGSLHLKENETVMLKTCVRYGQISMEEGDLEFVHPQWKTPDFITDRLKDKYRSIHHVKLCVISDEKGNLHVQELTTRTERAIGWWNELKKSVKNYFW